MRWSAAGSGGDADSVCESERGSQGQSELVPATLHCQQETEQPYLPYQNHRTDRQVSTHFTS